MSTSVLSVKTNLTKRNLETFKKTTHEKQVLDKNGLMSIKESEHLKLRSTSVLSKPFPDDLKSKTFHKNRKSSLKPEFPNDPLDDIH